MKATILAVLAFISFTYGIVYEESTHPHWPVSTQLNVFFGGMILMLATVGLIAYGATRND